MHQDTRTHTTSTTTITTNKNNFICVVLLNAGKKIALQQSV